MIEPAVNLRVMSEEERRRSIPILQEWLNATGEFIDHADTTIMPITQRMRYMRMRLAFLAYNKWLSK